MKLWLDIPNQFAFEHYSDHDTIRVAYANVIQAAMRLELEIEINRARLLRGQRFEVRDASEIRYAYHSEAIGDHVYCLKPGALPRYWFFDSGGYSGWSQMAQDPALQKAGRDFDLGRARAFITSYRDSIASRNLSKLHQPTTPLEPQIADLEDFIFLPLQVDHDRVLTHLPWVQSETLQRVAELAETHRRPVVIKRHPLCQSEAIAAWLETVETSEFVFVSEGSIHDLISGCSAVLVANSGVGLEALLQGKPVHTMARSEYRHMTRPVETLAALEEVFTVVPPPVSELTERLLGFFFLEYLVDSTDVHAIEARLRQHLQAHAQAREAKAAKPEDMGQVHIASALAERSEQHLAMTVEVMLKSGPPEAESARAEWEDILARAATLGIKRGLVLKQAGPDTCLHVANRLSATGEAPDWARKFAEAAIASPDHEGRARLVLARLALRSGQEDEAIRELRDSVACADATEQSHLALAQRLFRQGPDAYCESEAMARQALARNPEAAMAYLLLVQIDQARGEGARAAQHFRKARDLAPSHPAIIAASKQFPEGFDAS